MSYTPFASAQPSSQASAKTRQIAHLAQQLQLLAQRTEQLEQLSATTAEQASYMRLLGGYHAAWFMASQRVMTPGDASDDQGEAQGQQGQ
ncbi:hypothetical protein NBRC10512_007298 [Rhodotorula toruloides]|uniref:RHTO0S01e10352g1_1 n=2 Tax=Rhodotorula toruloides TaxID=5286 RepID=A0A061AFQ4_RHOTO|nr:uncharacterized protein RHTO_04797 [Rhodotorula toruloides NP11]EMS24618.1 protein of unknown function DUF1721, fungi [Rhodotorula toruloides NP11]CDR35928.1 RHTO0S01e10352g1_1 [Rhodotorula toruloides]